MFYGKQFKRIFVVALLAVAISLIATADLRSLAQQLTTEGAQRERRANTAMAQAVTTPTPRATPEDEPVDEDEVVRVETDLINVLFSVTDKDKRFITTLKQEDVRILEDGAAQEIFTFQRQTDLPLSLAILIGTSASQERTLPEEKIAAREFVTSVLRPNKDETAIISFTGEATLEQGLTGNIAMVRRAIDGVEFVPPSGYIGGGIVAPGTPPISDRNQQLAGGTAVWDAIWVASDEVLTQTSDKTRRAIILITDGFDYHSRKKLEEAVERAIRADAVVYSIGIGDSYAFQGVNKGALKKVSERTGGQAFFPRDEAELRAAFRQIELELRSQYVIAYSPTNKNRDGSYRRIQIEVTNPELRKQKLNLNYRQGYFAQSK